MHEIFDTFSLPLGEWLISISLAFTISPVLELAKMDGTTRMVRKDVIEDRAKDKFKGSNL